MRAVIAAIAASFLVANAVRADSFGPVPPTPIVSAIGSDVPLNNTAAYIDGPSVAQGNVGTFFASGYVTLQDSAGVGNILCHLTDGTNVIASTQVIPTNSTQTLSVHLSGFRTSPAGNLRIACKDVGSTSGVMKSNTGDGKDSQITVYRLQ